MSSDNPNNPTDTPSQRRGSMPSTAFANFFQRRNSNSGGTPAFPGPITTAAMNDHRRRLSISTFGLAGTSPTNSAQSNARRGSISTNSSDFIDENAVEDDEPSSSSRTAPNTPFNRRMSLGAAQAMRNLRGPGGNSPGSNGRPSPPLRRSSTFRGPPHSPTGAITAATTTTTTTTTTTANPASGVAPTWSKRDSKASNATESKTPSDLFSSAARPDPAFNWSEQLRSRAESSVNSGARPSLSIPTGLAGSSPRGNGAAPQPHHDRAKSVSDMPAPPAQSPRPRQQQQKPDHFQERILKGDFYMD